MPLYEYRCDSCTGTFERLVPFAERDSSVSCPGCRSERTHVLVSSFAFAGVGGDQEAQMSSGGCCGGGCGCSCSN